MSTYEPELGQMVFGNAYAECALGDAESLVANELYALSERIGRANPDEQSHGVLGGEWGYGQDFINDAFEMHPYWWGDCTCGVDEEDEETPHSSECRYVLANFKCGAVEVRWYKYIGRGMSVNREVSRKEWRDIFARCEASLS